MNLSEIVAASGLVSTVNTFGIERAGTGYLVSPRLVATCHHVVDGAIPATLRIVFENCVTPAHVLLSDAQSDCALLELDLAPAGVKPLKLARRCTWKAVWDGYGFPGAARGQGVTLSGLVSNPDATDDLQCPVLELTSFEAASGMASPMHGFSGSPVIVDGLVVGHIKRFISDALNPERPAWGKVYASRADSVIALLEQSGELYEDIASADIASPQWRSARSARESERIHALLDTWKNSELPFSRLRLAAAESLLELGESMDALRVLAQSATVTDKAAAPAADAVQPILHESVRAAGSFTGREGPLAELATHLSTAIAADDATRVVALYGMAGAGKTMLAKQFGWLNRRQYAGVWHLTANSEAGIVDGLFSLGERLLPQLAAIPDRLVAARRVLDAIAATAAKRPWLLIYDDVQLPSQLDGLLPVTGALVLITTRWSDWQGVAIPVALDVFSQAAAQAFLQLRAGRSDSDGAGELAGELGRLPLALEHAGAYCRRSGISFSGYARMHRARAQQVPRGIGSQTRSAVATFSTALEDVVQRCPDADRLMAILSFMEPDQIPLFILQDEMSDGERADAVAALAEVSLLSVDPSASTVSLHPLVRRAMRDRIAGQGHEVAQLGIVMKLLSKAFPSESDGSEEGHAWRRCPRLLPHVLAVAGDPSSHAVSSNAALHVFNQAGVLLTARAQYGEAELLLRRAVEMARSRPDSDADLATALSNLALLINTVGAAAAAEPLLRESLQLQVRVHGLRHPAVTRVLNNLAVALNRSGKTAEAEALYRRAIEVDIEMLGPEHVSVARDMHNLAVLLGNTARKTEAEQLHRRALAIDTAAYGSDSLLVATGLSNLGQLLIARGNHDEAAAMLGRAMIIHERALGPDHPAVGRNLNNLGQLLVASGRDEEARPHFERALRLLTRTFGSAHPDTARVRENLAACSAG